MSELLEQLAGTACETCGWELPDTSVEESCLVFESTGPKRESLRFWVRPAGIDIPCFKTAGHYLVGYEGKDLPETGIRLLNLVATRCESLPPGLLPVSAEPGPDSAGQGREESPAFIYGKDQFEVRVTQQCSQRCVFCNSWGTVENLAQSREHAFRLAGLARRKGANKLVISGGEPLLVPWVPDLIEHARKLEFRYITVQTNGILLADTEVLRALCEAGPDEFLVSLHGSSDEVVGTITGRPGLFQAGIAGLNAVLAQNFRVAVNYVVCRQNLEEIDLFVRMMASLPSSPFLVAFSFVAPSGLAWENREKTIPSASEAAPKLLSALRLASKLGLNVVHSEYCGIPTCVEPALREFAEPCTEDRPMHVPPDKRKLDRCEPCLWNRRCSGVFKRYIEQYSDREFGP